MDSENEKKRHTKNETSYLSTDIFAIEKLELMVPESSFTVVSKLWPRVDN